MWPSTSPAPSSRSASTQRDKSVKSVSSSATPGKRKKSISPSTAAKTSRAPPLVPTENDEGAQPKAATRPRAARKAPAKSQRPVAENILPGWLQNPINVNHEGKYMDLEERRVGALIDAIPETLKSIRRMCAGLSLSSRSAPAGGSTSTTMSSTGRDITAPAPASSAGVVIATKRTSSTSPTPPQPAQGGASAQSAGQGSDAASSDAEIVDKVIESIRVVEALLFPLPALQTAKPFALPVVSKASLLKRSRGRATKRRHSGGDVSADDSALSYYHTTLKHVTPKRRRLAWKAFLHRSTNAFSLLIGSLRCEAVLETPRLCVELVTLLYNLLRNIPSTQAESSAEKEKKAVKYCERLGIVKVLSAVMRRYHAELQKVERKSFSVEETAGTTVAEIKLRNEITVERFQCLRVIEATVLLYTEVAKVNVKVNSMLRLSKDLRRILDTAQYVAFACVLRTLQSHNKLSDYGCQTVSQAVRNVGGPSRGARHSTAVKDAIAKNRRDALKGLEVVSRATSFYLGALSHMLMTIFMSTRTALGAQEVGLKGVALGVRITAVLAEFLYVSLPKVRRVIAASFTSEKSVPDDDDGPVEAPFAFKEPAWVVLFKRRLEMTLFWSIAVVQRICENDKKTNFSAELHERNHIMASLFLVLKSTGKESGQVEALLTGEPAGRSPSVDGEPPVGLDVRRRSSSVRSAQNSSFAGGAYEFSGYRPPGSSPTNASTAGGGAESEQGDVMDENEEITLAAMTTMHVLLRLNRSKALDELDAACGGLAGVVREVLKFRSDNPEQWHRYFTLMSLMYGVRILPGLVPEAQYDVDSRLPPFMFAAEEDEDKVCIEEAFQGRTLSERLPLEALAQPCPLPRSTRSSSAAASASLSAGCDGAPRLAASHASGRVSPQMGAAAAEAVERTSNVDGHDTPKSTASSRKPLAIANSSSPSASGAALEGTPRMTPRSASHPNPSLPPASPQEEMTPYWRMPDSTRAKTPPLSPSTVSRGGSPAQQDPADSELAVSPQPSPSNTSFGEVGGLRAAPIAGAADGGLPHYLPQPVKELLLVDRRPASFSPELRLGDHLQLNEDPILDPESALEDGDYVFPWRFDEPGPPATNMIRRHRNESGPPAPLQGPTRTQKVSILKHQISRLRALSQRSTDLTTDISLWHHYNIVYEREDVVSRLREQQQQTLRSTARKGKDDDAEEPYEVPVSPAEGIPTPRQQPTSLAFSSNFESGNLKRAVRVTPHEYDLVMNWDTSSNGFTQWFCFGVADYEPGATYRFNILNMEKKNSCFNEGQRPLMLCVPTSESTPQSCVKQRASRGGASGRSSTASTHSTPQPQVLVPPGGSADWQRAGQDIYYYANTYGRPVRNSLHGRPYNVADASGLEGVRSGGAAAPSASQRSAASQPRVQVQSKASVSRSSSTSTCVGPRLSPAASHALAASGPRRGTGFARQDSKAQRSVSPGNRSRDRSASSSSKSRPLPTPTSARNSPQSGVSPVAAFPVAVSRGVSPQRAAAAVSRNAAPTKASAKPKASPAMADIIEPTTNFYTLSFSVTMPSRPGRVYLTNCFPYTYSELRSHLNELAQSQQDERERSAADKKDTTGRYVAMQSLCRTMGGLPVPLVTVTARRRPHDGTPYSAEEIAARPICILTARIHPGETNSSWMMHGMLEALLRSHVPGSAGGVAREHHAAAERAITHLLHRFVFKVIPMLNPDGVVMGNHRCSLAGVDLNRDYLRPDAEVNPTIYAVHRYVQHVIEKEGRAVALFADFHGHSVAKNFLMYGCTESLAQGLARRLAADKGITIEQGDVAVGPSATEAPDDTSAGTTGAAGVDGADEEAEAVAYEKLFPILMGHTTPSFGLSQCSFSMQTAMRKTGRVVQYRKYGIRMSYTIEGTMAGGSGADFVCPWTAPALPKIDPGDHDVGEEAPVQTHYTQDGYSALGHSFLSTLRNLVAIDEFTRRLAGGQWLGDSASSFAHEEEDRVPIGLLKLAWEQLLLSGTGKAAPAAPSDVDPEDYPRSPGEVPLAAAGAYVVATRTTRRTGASPSSSDHSSPVTGSPLQPSYTMAPDPENHAVAPGPRSTAELTALARRYQAALRFLFSTASSRVPDEGESEEESAGDNDSDDGAGRASPQVRRRTTPTGTAGATKKKKTSTAGGGSGPIVVKRRLPKKAAATVPVARLPVTDEPVVFVGTSPAPEDGTPSAASPMSQAFTASTTTEVPAGDDTEAGTATLEGDGEGSRRGSAGSPTAREVDDATEVTTEAAASPREDDSGDEDASAVDPAMLEEDGGFMVSLSDDDDLDDMEGSDGDDSDDEATLARTQRQTYDEGDADEDVAESGEDDDADTFVDHGSDIATEMDFNTDTDEDADYGELEPMPSNVFI